MSSVIPCIRHALRPHWEAQLYPDDLPEDWRLDYFANEFPALIVLPDWWQRAEFAEQCEEEVEGAFSLLLELDACVEPDTELLLRLAPDVLVLPLLGELPVWLESLAESGLALCLYSDSTPDAVLRDRVESLSRATLCWMEAGQLQWVGEGPELVVATAAQQPRELRSAIEEAVGLAGERRIWLLLDGVQEPVATLRSALQLVQLMGY